MRQYIELAAVFAEAFAAALREVLSRGDVPQIDPLFIRDANGYSALTVREVNTVLDGRYSPDDKPIETIQQLAAMSTAELRDRRGCGERAIVSFRAFLKANGLSFRNESLPDANRGLAGDGS